MMDERPFEGWFCLDGKDVIGPLGRSRLRELARQGRLRPDQTVWAQRLPDGELLAPARAGEVLRRDRFAALVADDDLAAAASLAHLVREAGADHCVISTGDEAVRAATALEPEVVFIDVGLTCLAGYALAAALRHLPRRPRVAALTGPDTPATRKAARAPGSRYWLAKPADAERVRDILAQLGRPAPAR